MKMVGEGTINRNAAKKVLIAVVEEGVDPIAYCKEQGLDKKVDTSAMEGIIDRILAENAQAVADFKGGKVKAMQALFGACMKELKGAGDPATIKALLEKKLAE
jgi:aspartyl-tRNA(Asn)/glutamyl-tRNA(Gln) amidotransferase subunit B